MKAFEAIQFDPAQCLREAQEFRSLLTANSELKERRDILPFFKKRKQLSAYLDPYRWSACPKLWHRIRRLASRVAEEMNQRRR